MNERPVPTQQSECSINAASLTRRQGKDRKRRVIDVRTRMAVGTGTDFQHRWLLGGCTLRHMAASRRRDQDEIHASVIRMLGRVPGNQTVRPCWGSGT